METGMELDGVWTSKRVVWSIVGILAGIFVYFGAKSFVLHPEDAGGKFLWPETWSFLYPNSGLMSLLLTKIAPLVAVLTIGARIVQYLMSSPGKSPPFRVPATKLILTISISLFLLGAAATGGVTNDAKMAGEGPYFLDLGLSSLGADVGVKTAYEALSPGLENTKTGGQGSGARYFSSLSGVYYLFYFGLIGVFGIYWAIKSNSKICLLYTSPSPRDQRGSRMPSSA